MDPERTYTVYPKEGEPVTLETTTPNPLTCSLQEASAITGLSYDYLSGQSKIANPKDRLPGFKTGKSTFRVIVAELPHWLNQKAGIA